MILGIDIGTVRLESGRIDESGRVLSSRSIRTPDSSEGLETALLYIVASGDPPAGIGIGCGDPRYLGGGRLEDLVRPALRAQVPIVADNGARAALAGEAAWGAARGCSEALLVTLDKIVGGAVMAGGRLIHGHTGAAGQLGHIPVEPDGALCACGSRGCLETVISASAIEAEAASAIERGCVSLLAQWFGPRRRGLTCQAVFEAAAGGDFLARSIVLRAVGKLGTAVASLLCIFDSEVVIVGGTVADAGRPFFDSLRADVASRLGPGSREVPIVPRQVVEHAGIMGAAALVRDQLMTRKIGSAAGH